MISWDYFDDKLNNVVKSLAEFEPAEDAWIKIESRLDFEKKVDNEIPQLPKLKFKENTWNKIENELVQNRKTKTNTKIKKLVLYSFSAAASIVLLLGISKLFIKNDEIEISYSQEYVGGDKDFERFELNDLNPLKYLEENCETVPDVCETPEFLEQKQILIELNNEHKNLTEVIKNYGESPELIKSLIKVENLKSEIVKEMMKAINS